MPFNGSGVFQRVRNWVADATAGIKIRADYHDSEDDGFAVGLTNCITKDGQTLVTQNIPFNNKRITGLADPVNPQDAATKASLTTAIAASVPATGGTMTGDLIVEKDDAAIKLNTNAGFSSLILGQKDDETRWALVLGDEAAESTGNVGSNFLLERYDDAGVIIDAVLTIDRATGLAVVKGPPTVDNGIATKKYVSDTFQAKDAQLFAGIPFAHVNNYTTVATDAQKCVAGTGTITINSGLYAAGTVITFAGYTGPLVIACSGGTLYWNDGRGATGGNRTIPDRGIATALKTSDGNWIIGGTGMT